VETVTLPEELRAALVAHARAGAPLEACGIVAGRDGRPTRFYPAANAAASPTFYQIAPEALLRITMDIEARGESIWGIFHSHPATEAYPSPTDIRLAFYPDALYLICSLRDPTQPTLRAFRIREGRVAEVALTSS
jgi:proteasome lid subunit RPN8/RPN11